MTALHSYLVSFMKRAQPLVDFELQRTEAEAEFEKLWEEGKIEGWEDSVGPKPKPSGNTEGIWCSACKYIIYSFNKSTRLPLSTRPKNVLETDGL